MNRLRDKLFALLATLLAGCGAEQPMTPAAPPVKEPVAAEPAPVVASDPNMLDPVPALSGADGEESVDDILAELNAIQLDGEEGNPLGDPDKVVALLHEGNTLIAAGKPDAALAKYDEALQFAEKEGDPDLFFNKGIAYKAKGEADKAITEYRRALELAPDYAEAHNNLGNLLKDLKRHDEAIQHFEASIRVFPDNPSTHNNLGTVHAMKGDVNKAAVCFAKAVRLEPTYVDARQNLGVAYMQQGRLAAAEKELAKAVKMAQGGMVYEQQRLAAAKASLARANSPEEQNAVRKEISAAQQAGNAATGKYRRGMEFLRSVQARRGETPAP
ncbi:MAG: tetratricopeptide repeat protein [Verrucomicrobiota bacterium]|nr:tetratricopeptide repeat protein [Verrucomicrobiota bacterium]